MSVIEEQLHDRIRAARAHACLSQRELAEKLGVAVRTVQSWEGGTRTPRSAALRELARVTGLPLSWFFSSEAAASTATPDKEA